MGIGDWGLGIGDWGLGIGDWAQSPIPNPQSPFDLKEIKIKIFLYIFNNIYIYIDIYMIIINKFILNYS